MHSLVDTHLDHARPRSAQDTEKITLLREAVCISARRDNYQLIIAYRQSRNSPF
jgi:hypothetical protein